MKLILHFDNEYAANYPCTGATLTFCSHGEKLPRQGGLRSVGECVVKADVNKNRSDTVHRGKVDPGVIDLLQGN